MSPGEFWGAKQDPLVMKTCNFALTIKVKAFVSYTTQGFERRRRGKPVTRISKVSFDHVERHH